MQPIKIILFHILLSSRWLVLVASKFLALAFLSGFALSISIETLSTVSLPVKILMAISGVIFTSIFWFYDYLILHLKPKMLDIILIK
ncbi:MAG: hypothetical protein KF702_00495 [Gammaproteobacteria bacterium]|nr:hypothetical protein [Gammaproteobacteria bacterium]